jgi:6-pyruvoyltetrahydropterin/6-carboxytetrahydropterin synthase
MKAHLTKRYSFPASHRLHRDDMSAQENQAIYGKCNNPHGHGHNYAVEITVSGQVDPKTGMVCNLADLDQFTQTRVINIFDHANLNCLPQFAGAIPSTENLCIEIYNIFKQGLTFANVEKIRIEETSKNSFEYGG